MISRALKTRGGQFFRRTLGLAFDLPVGDIPTLTPQQQHTKQLIPQHLVQTWEVNEFGRRHRQSLLDLRKRNPDLEFELLDQASRDEFMKEFIDPEITELYFDSAYKPMRVDLFRYAYLLKNGGYYCDISMNHLGQITSQHSRDASAVIAFENNSALRMAPKAVLDRLPYPSNLMAIWLLGFTPNHPILRTLLAQIKVESQDFKGKIFPMPKFAIIALTGPAAFTRAVWAYLESEEDDSVEFAGVDFNQLGRPHPGAGFRHIRYPSYARAHDDGLFLSDGRAG